jgi:hypothetical protein
MFYSRVEICTQKELVMKTPAMLTAAATLIGGVISTAPASAAPGPHLDWGHQLTASEISCPSGDKVLNVNYKIINSVDSGSGTNDDSAPWWAFIDYVLQLQVVELEPGVFCATVKNQGSFESIGGDGPGCFNELSCGQPEGRLEPGVIGTFQGGYTETFTGTFAPTERTRGSIGTFDQNCSSTGVCDGAGVTRWLGLYFTDVDEFDFDEWWGWIYRAGNNGVWVNANDGNDGNITGD